MIKFISLIAMLISSTAFAQIPGLSQPNVVGGNIILDSGPRWFYEQATSPTHQSERIVCYGKESGVGVTELYCKNSAGVEVQITAGGSPVGSAQWLGETTLAYDGDAIGSLTLANTQCKTDTADPLARVCTDNDIIMLIASGSTFGGLTDEVWVHDGTPGYTTFANNCDGWTSVAVGYYSGYWNLNTRKAYVSGCAMSKKYACCK